MSRQRLHLNNAEKQRAYREHKQQGLISTVPRPDASLAAVLTIPAAHSQFQACLSEGMTKAQAAVFVLES
jgi:hypothetical protein